jgi:hypothetical protein
MKHTERSMDSKMEDQILSFRIKDLNQMGKRDKQEYSSSGFYESHGEGHMYASIEETNKYRRENRYHDYSFSCEKK